MAPAHTVNVQDIVSDYLAENVWVPILAITSAVIVVILIVYCVWRCRHNMRYDYSILKADLALPEKLEMERKLQYDTMRETALLHCQFYLRSSGLYTPVEHLPEIGSRVGKQWFIVRDTRSKVDKLLTMLPRGARMMLPFTTTTSLTVKDLLLHIQHPYIFPIYDIDLLAQQDRVVVILPFNNQGSLKDLIYHAHCKDTWASKYYMVGTGLPPHLVATYGRQILEGLIFLQKSGFPPLSHLHSGNVMLQNNTCRLAGYESELLGLSPKMYGITTKSLQTDTDALQVIYFGHLIYEMTMGNEMEVSIPESRHLAAIPDVQIKQCLEFIFDSSEAGFHTLEQICNHPFFNLVALKELEVFKKPPVKFTKKQKAILKAVKRGKPLGLKRASAPALAIDTDLTGRARSGSRQALTSSSKYQLPLPLELRKEGAPRKPHHSPTTRQTPLPSHAVTAVTKPAIPPKYKPAHKLLPQSPAPAPTPVQLVTPLPVEGTPLATPGERTALLSDIRKGVSLRNVQPRV